MSSKPTKNPAAQVEMAHKAAAMAASHREQTQPQVIKNTPPRPPRRAQRVRRVRTEKSADGTDGDDGAIRLLSKAQVLDRVGLSFPTIWAMMRTGSFPRARIIGGKSAWLESEINAWIKALPLRPYKGDQAA